MEAPLNKNRGQQGNGKSDSLHDIRAFRRESTSIAFTDAYANIDTNTDTSWDANAYANSYADTFTIAFTDTARL